MNEKNEIRTRYDTMAERIQQYTTNIKNLHSDVSPVMKYFRQRKVETALSLARFKKGSRLLEIGSGIGQYTTIFAERGFQMLGIDLSGKAVEVAKTNAQMSNFKNIDYFQADVENLDLFEDERFDGVVSFSTLRYVPNLKKALKEIYRVTRKNGVVALDFPNRLCPWFKLLKNKFGVENHIHDHFYSGRELTSLFKESGFKNIETKTIMYTHYTFPPKLLKLYKIIDSIAEHTLFIKELAAIVICKGIKA